LILLLPTSVALYQTHLYMNIKPLTSSSRSSRTRVEFYFFYIYNSR